MAFSRRELESYRNASVPDLLGPSCRLLFVGINPGLWTAAVNTHFAHPGNRFYPALYKAGITEYQVDRGSGFTLEDRSYLIRRGIGITNLVNRATVRAGELSDAELRDGAETLRSLVEVVTPRVVAVVGITAYRVAFERPKAALGHQPDGLCDSELWVLPNPSGLNAHETIDTLADWYRQPARAAGVV